MGVRAPRTFGGTVSNGLGGRSRIPAPATPIAPHLTLPEPLPPPQPEPPEQPRCEPFPSQPPPRDSADSTASQAQHVTSDQRSTAFRAQASGGLAGADGLPEVVGGAWARPARLELRVWGPGSGFPREMPSRLWIPLLATPGRGRGCLLEPQPALSPAGRPPITKVLYCSPALSGDSAVSSNPAVAPRFVALAPGRCDISL
ncbi:uncharacterized protein LOC109492038 [Felis catus]|uniref:uncharacterized protein LOC109492038 n=1 Tax=Felis catus TaxID=9685 RepID=UPI001D1A1A60|nr:uncharacterized protein LOC109492038 [Felis catus]